MTNVELAVLFDMVKHHVALVDVQRIARRPDNVTYDLYTVRPSAVHQQAVALLVLAGLAKSVLWGGLVCYWLDDTARAALIL